MTHPNPSYGPVSVPDNIGVSGPSQTRSARNPLGLVSLIVGVGISVIGLISQLATALLIGSGGIAAVQVSSAISAVLSGILALVALGLGIAGLLRKGAPKAAAGAGTALGAAAIVGLIGSLLYPLFVSLGYS